MLKKYNDLSTESFNVQSTPISFLKDVQYSSKDVEDICVLWYFIVVQQYLLNKKLPKIILFS